MTSLEDGSVCLLIKAGKNRLVWLKEAKVILSVLGAKEQGRILTCAISVSD